MKKTMKKLLALLLALAMCLSLCAPAWAAEESAEDGSVTAQSAEGISVEEAPAGEVPAAEPSEEETPEAEESTGDNAAEEAPAQGDMSDKEEAPAENDASGKETSDAAPAEAAPEEAPALETQDEEEPVVDNDSYATARPIDVNSTITDSLPTSSSTRYYKVQFPEQGCVSIDFTTAFITANQDFWIHNEYYWYVYLIDEKKNGVITYGIRGDTSATQSTPEIGVPAGGYYVVVTPTADGWGNVQHSSNDYDLKVNFQASSQWEVEKNNTFGTSQQIVVGKEYSGSIHTKDDEDYFQFTTPKNGVVSLSFVHPYIDGSNNNTVWESYLYDSTNALIAQSDFKGNRSGTFQTMQIGLPEGSYYLRITKGESHSSATYQMRVNFDESSSWETEFNNSFYEATPIERGKTYSGTIMNSDDVDYYKITLKKKSTIGYTFQHPYIDSSDSYWETGLYDADGNYIIGYYQKGNTGKKLKGAGKTLKAGTYYLKVTKSNRHSTEPYKISIIHRHSYTKKITKKPTLAAKGTAKFTCKECGDSYTKSVPKLKPTGVSSFRVERVYNDYYTTKHEIKFTWTRNKKADGYVIQACQNSDFSGRKSLQIKGGKNTSGTLKLKSGGYYHCRIKAYQKYKGKVYYSEWHTLNDNGTLYVY